MMPLKARLAAWLWTLLLPQQQWSAQQHERHQGNPMLIRYLSSTGKLRGAEWVAPDNRDRLRLYKGVRYTQSTQTQDGVCIYTEDP